MDIGKTRGALMRLYEIKRWSMVEVRRQQNVAEHTFAVMIIAEAIYEVLYPVSHNSFAKDSVRRWAMYHDAEEYWVTDMPSPVKRAIQAAKGGPEALDAITEKACNQALQEYLNLRRGIKGTMPEAIVRLADRLEALSYFNEYGLDTPANRIVDEYLKASLNKAWTQLRGHPMSPLHNDPQMNHELGGVIDDILYPHKTFVPHLMRVRHGLAYYEDDDQVVKDSSTEG